MARESLSTKVRRRTLGLAFIVVVLLLLSTSVLIYQKFFTSSVTVYLKTDHTGNQLDTGSDVKVRGVLVGEVRSIKSQGDGATLKLALDPSKVNLIPNNVTAEILPKTLFGERYVNLELPSGVTPGSYTAIRGGETISQDHSTTAIEFEQVLTDVLPVLNALKPAELSATLNAIATALNGRGAQLGQNLTELGQYLTKLNLDAQPLVNDLQNLGTVSTVYNQAAPQLLDTLSNLQTTSATLEANQSALANLLVGGSTTANTVTQFLDQNGQYLINVAAQTNEVSALLARYSPEYTCFLQGLAADEPLFANLFRNNELHVEIQFVPNRGFYVQGNQPVYKLGIGPGCYGLPNPQIPFNILPYANEINDGAPYAGGANTGSQVKFPASAAATPLSANTTFVGSDTEANEINALIAGEYGTSPNQVPGIATVLGGTLLRGATVSAK